MQPRKFLVKVWDRTRTFDTIEEAEEQKKLWNQIYFGKRAHLYVLIE